MKRFALHLCGLLVISCTATVAETATLSTRETLRNEALNMSSWALSALDETVPPEIRRNLTFLREDLLDETKTASDPVADSFKLGVALCDSLIAALDAHDAAAVKAGYRATQAVANTAVTSQALEARRSYKMSWPQYAREQDQRAEIARQANNQVALANQQVRVEWANRAAQIRIRLDEAYKRYRSALRNDPGFQTSVTSSSDSLFPPPKPLKSDTNNSFNPGLITTTPPSLVPEEVRDLLTPEFENLSIDERIIRITAKVKQMNPKFNGVINWTKDTSGITGIGFPGSQLDSIWPLCSLPQLRDVSFGVRGKGKNVNIGAHGQKKKGGPRPKSSVSDLSPLRGMQLRSVSCMGTEVKDLSVLTGMPLDVLDCTNSLVTDLSPLLGMQLTRLSCAYTNIADVSPLRGMPLQRLKMDHTQVHDLSPLSSMPLQFLFCNSTMVSDLSPLRSMTTLKALNCDFRADRDATILRSVKSLRHINGFPVEDFWKRVDAGESPQFSDSL